MKRHDRNAWCNMFASLYGFAVDSSRREALAVTIAAYQRYGELTPSVALQLVLRMPLSWPRTASFEPNVLARNA